MNPIFHRRTRGALASCHNNSAGNSPSRNPGTSHSRQSEDRDHEDEDNYEHKPLINGEISSNATTDDHRDPQIRPLPPFTQRALFSRANRSSISRDSVDSGDTALSHLALGQNLLESKQNLLAKVNLSAADDELRQRAEEDGLVTEPEEFLQSNSTKAPSRSRSMNLSTESSEMKLSNIESNSTNTITHSVSGSISMLQRQGNPNPTITLSQVSFEAPGTGSLHYQKKTPKNMQSRVKAIDMGTWRELKALVLGPRGVMHEGWFGQGFSFNHKIPFGLVQKKGGPCGILSVVQALLLRNLMFGSDYCESDLTVPGLTENILSASTTNHITLKRSLALAGALTEILWRCGGNTSENTAQVPAAGGDNAEGVSGNTSRTTLCFNGAGSLAIGPGSEQRIFYDLNELKTVVKMNLHRFDCIGMVYSAVLSRGIQNIQEDMDFGNSPLLGQHGYCTQELLNLLTMGRGISNAFDHEYVLGDKVLKGLTAQADIGLLSLFEHYDSCRVGSFLKNPKYPLWIVCSESHFSLLFSNDLTLTANPEQSPQKFDLYYYDGLARQEKIIKLTIESNSTEETTGTRTPPVRQVLGTLNGSSRTMSPATGKSDEDLVPPLEKCIRTKWKGVRVDWNDAEPIL